MVAQRELNKQAMGTHNKEKLELAIIAECGELVQELKFGVRDDPEIGAWCWWKREDTSWSDREFVLGEVIDILHFVLTGLIDEGWLEKPSHVIRLLEAHLDISKSKSYLRTIPETVTDIISSQRFFEKLIAWLRLVYLLGYTIKDVDDFFGQSVEKNLTRWGEQSDASE